MRYIGFFLALLGMCTQSGCTTSTTNDADGRTKLSIALNWIPDSQHGGFYAAEVHGFFEQEGLDVEILPGGPNAPVIQQVAMRRAEFGVGNADQILMARREDADVVAVMAAMQNSPRCIMVHAESGIKDFDGIKNTKLAIGTGKAFAKYLQSNVSLTNVTIVPYTGSIIPFLNDKAFAQQAYVFSEPQVAESEGAEVRTLMVSDLGFNPYSSCLFTQGDIIRDQPDVVEKVVRAVRKGWIEYLRSPHETNLRIRRDNAEMTTESLEFGATAIRSLCLPDGSDENTIGSMTNDRWRELADQLTEMEYLQNAENFSNAFNLDFLREL